MIILGLLRVVFTLLQALFSWLSIPAMPEGITSVVGSVLGYITDALPLIWLFLDKGVVGVCLVVAVACMNFEKMYDMLMWILAKLPIGITKN